MKNSDVHKLLSEKLLNKKIFFPSRYKVDSPVRVKVDGADLCCLYYPVEQPRKTVVFFYGNGENALHFGEKFSEIFNYYDCSLFISEYRGYGMSTGTPTLPNIMRDVKPIISSLGINQEDLVVFGRSMGIFSIIEAIHEFPKISGVILDSCHASPISFLDRRMENISDEMRDSINRFFGFVEKIGKYKGQVLIMHSRHDYLAHVRNAEYLRDYFECPVKLLIFDEGSHNSIINVNAQQYFTQIESFINHLCSKRTG